MATWRRIWPEAAAAEVGEAELEELYSYPADSRWIAVNFVSSADGAVELGGRAAGLSNPADQHIFQLGRDLADVVLVGAGTSMIEQMQGTRQGDHTAERRRRHGLGELPPVAVVTTGGSLAPDATVITEAVTPTIVLTCAAAPAEQRKAWGAAGAEVLIAGDDRVDLTAAVDALAERGLRRIDCEGGPRLFGSLLDAGLGDELRLTVAPLLVAGGHGRITMSQTTVPVDLKLASVLAEGDSLFLRYLLHRADQ